MDKKNEEEVPLDIANVIEVTGDFIESSFGRYYQGNDSGYHSFETQIIKIVDKYSQTIPGIWKEAWTEIASGIETCQKAKSKKSGILEQHIRIYRSACPMHVQLFHSHIYTNYESAGDSNSYKDWCRYEVSNAVEVENTV
jgi:hypothetical protein